jgi:hypothetical protein
MVLTNILIYSISLYLNKIYSTLYLKYKS